MSRVSCLKLIVHPMADSTSSPTTPANEASIPALNLTFAFWLLRLFMGMRLIMSALEKMGYFVGKGTATISEALKLEQWFGRSGLGTKVEVDGKEALLNMGLGDGKMWPIAKAMLDYTMVLDIGALPGKAGTALGGTLGGLFHSSARAELAGLATGLLAPTAVHIGLDNMGVTQKIATILDGTVSRRRPWSLQPDGDLWRFVDSIILQRGINSSSCDWIKGQVSLQMLDQGYPMRDAIYNSYADAAADAAHRISTMKVQHEILSIFAQKQ